MLVGRGIEARHCIIHNESGQVNLVPLDDAACYVNNVSVHEPVRLNQGLHH